MTINLTRRGVVATSGAAALAAPGLALAAPAPATLLNVSYDPTREFYKDFDKLFAADWAKKTGQAMTINQSHDGSGKQARAVVDGLEADVVTLALAYDIDQIAAKGLIAPNWQSRLPDNSTPYTSTIVFLVRAGNPKKIHDWIDLVKAGVQVITANPKTSGGARWSYLAALAYATRHNGGNEAKALHEAVLGGAAVTFVAGTRVFAQGLAGAVGDARTVQRGQGDVLIAWENEALLSVNKLNPGEFEIVYPSETILAEPPVAVVDKIVDKHGTRKAAEAYLRFLYTDAAQDLAARRHFRPRNATILAKYAQKFPSMDLVTIASFGGWSKAQAKNFVDGGAFDKIYTPG